MSLTTVAQRTGIFTGHFDDELVTRYEVLPDATPTHIRHDGITRTGVRFDASASGLGKPVKSVWVRFRKYGLPAGPITVNIRKGSDDTVAATIGERFDISQFPQGVETELVVRNRFNNTYNMVEGDLVSIEYPSNATNGFEITTHSSASNPSNYTSRSWNGSIWSNTADPLCITIKS